MIVDAVVKTSNISLMNLDLGACGLTGEGDKHVARLIESDYHINCQWYLWTWGMESQQQCSENQYHGSEESIIWF